MTRVRNLFLTYRVLAFVVGVLLAFCSLVALPLKYLATEGTDLQQFGDAPASCGRHGWVFMVYVVVAFLLSRRAGWSMQFTVLMLVGRPDPGAHLLGGAPRRAAAARRARRAGPA